MTTTLPEQAPFCCRCGAPRQAHCLCYEDVFAKAAFLEGENAKLGQETKPPELAEASLLFSQENDSCDDGDMGQELRVEMIDAGGGKYFIIKTERWAFDSVEELVALLRKAETFRSPNDL
jgi:hypothetical protein